MKYDSRFINKPYAQAPLQRTLWGMVTAACWAFYIYLLAPLLTVLLWLSGFHTARFELYQREHAVEPFLLMMLPMLALACILLLLSWAEYNRWRFVGRTERRTALGNTSMREIANHMGASVPLAQSLAGAKVVTLHMDEHARPISMTSAGLPLSVSQPITNEIQEKTALKVA